MTTPKISVIIPTYNRAHLIENTIKSVINQTFTDWELLVCDDGSTDNTKEIVDEFIKKDNRIKYFYQKSSAGPSSPRNLGIEKATGEYVAFLDSDDEWFPTKLDKQLALFENSNNPKLGVVACFAYVKNYKTEKIISKHNRYYKGNALKEILKNDGLICTTSCVMTKLSILKEVGPFDSIFKVYDDTDMWLRISERGYEINYIQEYLLNYMVHDSNIFYENKYLDEKFELTNLVKKHIQLYLDYDYSNWGNKFFLIKEYKLARKFILRDLFGNRFTGRQKIRMLGQLIITYYPPSEQIWQNIKKIFKK